MGFEVGQVVADYEVVGILGAGGMGCVYQVRNGISQRTEAMKVLLADLNAEADLAARFRSEIRTLASLDHPNIASLRTALQDGNQLVMVMEFVEGCTLHELAYQTPLPMEKVVGYIQQVLTALSYAHRCGVVHRDIKPANIMVTPQGTVKLTDFGIAKSRRKDDLTRPGTTLGSLNYMSPEQALGNVEVDQRSDLYSVGITLYELLVGKRPFEDESAYVVLQRQLNLDPQPPIEVNPLLSQPLSDLILKSLAKDPALRFQTAKEFSDALHSATNYISGDPIISGALWVAAKRPALATVDRNLLGTGIHIVPTGVKEHSLWSVGAISAIVLAIATAAGVPLALRSGTRAATPSIVVVPSAPNAVPGTVAATSPISVATAVAVPEPVQSRDQAPLPAADPSSVEQAKIGDHALPVGTLRSAARPAIRSVRLSKDNDSKTVTNHAKEDLPKDEVVPPPVLSPATLAAVRAISKQKDELDAKAGVLRARVTRLRSEKAVEGRPLNQEIADAYVNMNENLGAENTDLESGDVSAAQNHMQKAAFEMSLLEKHLSE